MKEQRHKKEHLKIKVGDILDEQYMFRVCNLGTPKTYKWENGTDVSTFRNTFYGKKEKRTKGTTVASTYVKGNRGRKRTIKQKRICAHEGEMMRTVPSWCMFDNISPVSLG